MSKAASEELWREWHTRERRCTLWLGYYHWYRDAEKWRAIAEDPQRPPQTRLDAKKSMERDWARMRLCKAAGRYWRGDSEDASTWPESVSGPVCSVTSAPVPGKFGLLQEELKQP
ncbi:hypothetical protein DES53_102776 [Roseimicrobium gellanilyticum]|uniref:Uncharacterized protein n=1 Tax=Roseimicrobium gellanilyticum TaxID=748857 RepID=A0A366HRS8_9BACT|nr:hypothetical protein DES53_102776 [Roseimicrobium gellanilyticum]